MTARKPTAVKVTGIVLLLASALLLASPAMANPVQIQVGFSGSNYGPYQTNQGGEFTLNDNGTSGDWLDLSAYSDQTKNFGGITSFQTFCVEESEYIYPNPATYSATLSAAAVNGGVGAGPNGDPISVGTGWLYSQFANGTLQGYNYGDANGHPRSTSADLLQSTIWWLESEAGDPGDLNPFRNAVLSRFTTEADAKAGDVSDGGTARYGVYAVNLTGGPYGVAQDQLYYAPGFTSAAVPDGGRTLAMLGMALCGMAIISRRLRRS